MRVERLAIWAVALLLAACGGTTNGSAGVPSPQTAENAERAGDDYPEGTAAATLAADGRFETLMGILEERASDRTRGAFLGGLSDPDWGQTLFAPTDDAFDAIPENELESIIASEADLHWTLDQHIARGAWPSERLRMAAESDVPLLTTPGAGGGWVLRVLTRGGGIQIAVCPSPVSACADVPPAQLEAATVVEADIAASNGSIHAIDGVLLPAVPPRFG